MNTTSLEMYRRSFNTLPLEKFERIIGLIRRPKSKDGLFNGQKKTREEQINNGPQNTKQKTKD
jgi:hypothetical protein